MQAGKGTQKSGKVKAFAPATVANVACGFDVLGFAIHHLGDVLTASKSDKPGVRVLSIDGDDGRLPMEASKNTAGLSVISLLEELGQSGEVGVDLEIEKKMPLGSGLGSSAASSVAAVVAVNHLLGKPFQKSDLLPFAVKGEMAASGSPHADNAAASLMGGFVLVKEHHPPDIISLHNPEDLYCTIIHPDIEIQTRNSRKLLKKQIQLEQAVTQWGNLGSLIAGLYSEDYELISRSLHDVIIEPMRSILIPGFDDMKAAALENGALGCSISGSGPSLFALSASEKIAAITAEKMGEVLKRIGLSYQSYISKINRVGATIMDES
ncbi:MAG: homoserine kinase [Bacteroidetes bacterium]|jgi:homoserine kinase|nr:homoserine kinase [Bacteroidota bacterium]